MAQQSARIVRDDDVADVYAALTYYYEHPEEIESIRERRHEREEAARDAGARTIGELANEHGTADPYRGGGTARFSVRRENSR